MAIAREERRQSHDGPVWVLLFVAILGVWVWFVVTLLGNGSLVLGNAMAMLAVWFGYLLVGEPPWRRGAGPALRGPRSRCEFRA